MIKKSSVDIAKERLKALVDSDRVSCRPEDIEKITWELYRSLSKYIELTSEDFSVSFTRNNIHIKLIGEDH